MLPRLTAGKIGRALLFVVLWTGLAVSGRGAVERAALTNLDRRISAARPAALAARGEQHAGLAALKARLPDAAVDFDPVFGSPKWVHSFGGTLTGAGGTGRAVADATAKRFEKDPDKPIKAFLEEHRALFRHGAEVLVGARQYRDHTNDLGMRTVAWEQQVEGIRVFDSVFVAHTTARGELISVSSQFVPEPLAAAERGTPNRAAKVRGPAVTVERALRVAAANLGEEVSELTALVTNPAARTLKQTFKLKPLPGEAGASLVWLPLDGDTLRLCWEVELTRREFKERFRLLVDAETGEVLLRRKLTVEVSEVLYRVYTSDSPSPMSPGLPYPTNAQPPYVPRQLLAISNLNATASPLGWINDGVLETRGNNVDAHLDRDNDNRADLPRPQATLDGQGRRVFDFPMDLNQSPTNYSSAAVVQLFYWCNFMHDRLYELGFNESAGNFQKDNFGRGGLGDDAVLAEAQDGSGFNNANFTPNRDGGSGLIQMYIFNGPTPNRDGDFDADVICHEYTHGLSDRTVGGGVGIDFGHPQSGGMGEGWSDFYAVALLSEFGDDLGGNYAMGGYVTYQFSGLTQNYYYGIRRYPYTTNLNVDPLTFRDIDVSTAASHPGIPRNPIIISSGSEVHRQGEIWCSMLWDMRAFLLRKYAPTNADDYANANQRVLRYVTRGMQLSPPNPSFVQARDAILLAINSTFGSESDSTEAWAAFARRGLGVGAVCPDSSTTVGVIESYAAPAVADFSVQSPPVAFAGIVGGPFAPLAITNVLLNSAATNVGWAAAVNATWLRLATNRGTLLPNVPFPNAVSLTSFASNLSVSATPYPATIFYTNLARTQVVALAVSLQVQAAPGDPLVIIPAAKIQIQGPVGGPFPNSTQSYQLSNAGSTSLIWRAFTTNNWLFVTPTNGTLRGNADLTNLTVTLSSAAYTLPAGVYEGAITVVNMNSGVRTDLLVSLRIGRVDYLTEDFPSATTSPFDLAYRTLTFIPDPSPNFYRACLEPATVFPTDPAGGTPLALGDDTFQQITLTNGAQVSIFGSASNMIWVGANGHLTFDPVISTAAFFPGLGNFFAATRVAALYADLNPLDGGTVSYLQLPNRLVVTYSNVPEYLNPGQVLGTNANSFQIEMFYAGTIRFTWLNISFADVGGAHALTGLSRGTNTPGDFVKSDLSAFSSCQPEATLVVPSVVMEGESAIQGTILLSAPVATNITITFSTSDTNELTTYEPVVIPAGQTVATFGFDAVDDGVADGTQRAILTVHFPDRPAVSASILVNDAETANLTLNVPAAGTEGGTLAAAGTVAMDVVAVRPVTVTLISDNPARVQVPASVVIAPGQSLAHFDLVLVDNDLFDGTQNVVIEASVVHWAGDFDVIRVSDNESRALLLALPGEVNEGQGTLTNGGTISFSGKPLTNVVLALQSDHPELIAVPALATNLAGQTSVKFNLLVGDNSVTNTFDTVRITVSAPGFTGATGVVTVVDDERPFAPSDPSPADLETHVARNTSLSWTVNSHAPPGTIYDVFLGTNADLSISSPVASTGGQTVALPRPLNPDTVYYWQVVARLAPFPSVAGPVWQFRTATFGLQFGAIASPQFVGEAFPITLTADDEYGLRVTNYTGPVTLTNFAAVKSSSTIVISEIDVNSIDRIEFQNVSGSPINIAGWKITLYDWQAWPAPFTTFTIPSASISRPGEVFQLRTLPPQLPPSFFPGAYPSFATPFLTAWNNNVDNNQIAVLLQDSLGNLVDFVCAAGADPALITQPAVIPPAQWSGPPIVADVDANLSYQRVGRRDQNSSNDWVFAARSIGTNNAGIFSSFSNQVAVAFSAAPFTFVAGGSTSTVTMLEEARGMKFGATDALGRGALSSPFDVLSRNDLALLVTASSDVLVNSPVTYQITVTNTGPSVATGVTLTDTLPVNSAFVSALPSQGSFSFLNGVVTCQLGSVAPGGSANVSLQASALSRGLLTNFVAVTRAEPDGNLANNTAVTVTSATFPQVSILDLTNGEPNTGTVTMAFSVRLTAPNAFTSFVAYATSDGTATAGLDYQPTNGVVIFPPGITNRTIAVQIIGDLLSESNETFFVNLSSATNLELNKITGVGTIADNDSSPSLSVGDVSVLEGNAGTVNAAFPVTLSAVSGKIVSVTYGTANGTALAGLDYQEVYGTLVFPPGVTNLFINVPVIGDTLPEPTKTFSLNLSLANNANLSRSTATGTIFDDDVTLLSGFTFDPVGPTNYAGALVPMTITARDSSGAVAAGFNQPVTLLALQEERTVTVGSNTVLWNLPFATAYHDARLQSIYLTNEIGPAGKIIGLALDVATVPPQVLSNFTIRLRANADSFYIAALWYFSGWTTNYQRDLLVGTTGWVTFAFSTPFDYSGRDHLMVDFSYDNSSFSADGMVRSTATMANRSVFARSDSFFGRPLDWAGGFPPPTAIGRVPNVRLILDRQPPLALTVPGGSFVNGVWSGGVMLNAPTTNVLLRVVDQGGHFGESNPFALILLRIASITRQGNAVNINFPTLNGSRYVVESSAALGGSWSAVSPVLTGDGSLARFTHTPPVQPQFYRVRLAP